MWQIVHDYQTLITGFFAIITAVIAFGGLYWQTHKDAANRREEAAAAALAEKLSILAAFEAEIKTLLELLEKTGVRKTLQSERRKAIRVRQNAAYRPDDWVDIKENYIRVYDANAGKVGLLGPGPSDALVRFYAVGISLIEQLNVLATQMKGQHTANEWAYGLGMALDRCEATHACGQEAVDQIKKERERLSAG